MSLIFKQWVRLTILVCNKHDLREYTIPIKFILKILKMVNGIDNNNNNNNKQWWWKLTII